ncbi:FAD-binding oxidoreductase [Frigidibacter albus]
MLDRLRSLIGAENVLTGADMAPWCREWTGHYRWTPLAVARPANTAEVAAILRLAGETGTKVVPVGGNTGLNGGTYAEGALMLSLARMNRIREIRPAARVAVVEAGLILEAMHAAAAEHGLAFPLTFGAKGSATIGGVISTNAGGSNVLRYGTTRALVLGVEVVLADGQVMDLMGALHKDNTGYSLRDLVIGAEGTLGIITAAVLKLVPAPRAYATATLALSSLDGALALLNRLQAETGGAVEAYEFMPAAYMARLARHRPDLRQPFGEIHPVTVLVEVGATAPRDATPGPDGALPVVTHLEEVLAEALEDGALLDAVIAQTEAQRREMWARREAAAEITFTAAVLVDTDVALPLDRLQAFLDAMTARLAALDPEAGELVVAHLGDGNIHYTAYPSRDDLALQVEIRAAVAEVAVGLGGSFSAEHGIGRSKLATLQAHKDPVALEAMRAIRAALDPGRVLNPGKTVA